MLDPADRLIIEDILRVTAAQQPPAGSAGAGARMSPAFLRFESYQRWGGQFDERQIRRRGGFKWLRAASVLAHVGVDLDNDGPDGDPRWLRLLASQFENRIPGNGATRIGQRAASRAEIVSDIVRVTQAAGLVPPLRPTFRQYRSLGGLHPYQYVKARGGWKALCAEAGYPDKPASREEMRKLVVQDIARVASAIAVGDLLAASSNGLSKSEYRVAGGRYSLVKIASVQDEEGWLGLCREAGVKPPAHRMRRLERERQAARAKAARAKARMGGQPPVGDSKPPAKTIRQRGVDAPDGATRFEPPRKAFALAMSKDSGLWKRRKRWVAMWRRIELDRDEILADLRLVARTAGVPLARMSLETYLASGGRYAPEDLRLLGGFGRACRIAAGLEG